MFYEKTQFQECYGHLWYFCVNGVFVHPFFCGFEYKLYYSILKILLALIFLLLEIGVLLKISWKTHFTEKYCLTH